MHFLSKRIKIQGFLSFLTLPGTFVGSRATSKERGKTMGGDMHWMVSLLVGTIVLAALLAGNQIKEH